MKKNAVFCGGIRRKELEWLPIIIWNFYK